MSEKTPEELEAEIRRLRRELDASNSDDETTETQPDKEPDNEAVFRSESPAAAPVENADNTSETNAVPEDTLPVPIPETTTDKTSAADSVASEVTGVTDEVTNKVNEIHRMVTEVHGIVTSAAPEIESFLSTVKEKGIAGIFSDMLRFGK